MNKKFLETVKRQSELAEKAAAGNASDVELKELAKLTEAIKAATAPSPKNTTTLKTMTLAEFKTWHDDIMAKDVDAETLKLVKRNIEAVHDQGVTTPDSIVAVEMPVEKSRDDIIEELEGRIAELESKSNDDPPAQPEEPASGEGDGEEDGDGEGEPTSKEEKPTAQALGIEAIDTLLAKYTALKSKLEAGALTKEDIECMYEGEWQLKDAIAQAVAIMAKAEELIKMVGEIKPEFERLAKDIEVPEGDDPDSDQDDDQDPPEPAEKGAPQSAWMSGIDLAPSATAEDAKKDIQEKKKRFNY